MTKTTCQENRETFSICQTAQAKKNLTVPQFGQKLKEKKKKPLSLGQWIILSASQTDESAGITEEHSTSCSLFQNPRPCCWCQPSFSRQSLA